MERLLDRVTELEKAQRASERRARWWQGAAAALLVLGLLGSTLHATAAPGGVGARDLARRVADLEAALERETAARQAADTALQAALSRQAMLDYDGDGFADIIVGTGPGAPGGHVKVFSGKDGSLLASFFAFGTGFTGGVNVAAGDINNDGRADIIAGAGPGAPGGHVKVFDGRTGAEIASFFAFPGFTGGVTVAGAP
jgi:hypothetical protein